MNPISSGGNAEQTKPTISEISQRLNNIDVSNSDKLSNELAGLTNDMNAEIRSAFEDGKITKDESSRLDMIMTNLCGFNGRIKMAMREATDDVKKSYEQMTASVSQLIGRLSDAMNGRDPDQLALEPDDTDADMAAEQPVKVPKRMYWKADQTDMEGVYEALVNPQGRGTKFYNRPQVKIGGLLGFIGEYSNRLDKEQIAYIRNYIQNLNSIEQEDDEKPAVPQGFSINTAHLPDTNKVKAYWNAIKSAGFSHDLESELMVLGYSKKDAKELASQV